MLVTGSERAGSAPVEEEDLVQGEWVFQAVQGQGQAELAVDRPTQSFPQELLA
jgi:hypothetical protein